MKYRLSDLRNFLETSTASKLTLAAKKLQISQPALSESIKRLESDLGIRLFYRSRMGIELTPGGRAFQEKARRALEGLDALDDSANAASFSGSSAITIGCHPVVAQYCLPAALSYLKSHAPDYKVNLIHDLSRKILQDIQLGKIDVGVLINPTQVPDLVVRVLGYDKIGIWRSKRSRTFDTVICEQDLFQTQSILRRWKQRPARIIQTTSMELMCQLVAQDVGWGIIPERAVKLSGLDLQMEQKMPTYRDEICLVHRPEFGKSASERLVLEALRRFSVDSD